MVKGTLKSRRLKPFQAPCVHSRESLLKGQSLFKICFALAFLLLSLKHLLVGELARQITHVKGSGEYLASEWLVGNHNTEMTVLWQKPCALCHWQGFVGRNCLKADFQTSKGSQSYFRCQGNAGDQSVVKSLAIHQTHCQVLRRIFTK